MAQGDAKLFQAYALEAGEGDYNNTTDTFKLALLTDTYASVAVTGVDPVLSDFTEVTPGGNYSAGGITLTGVSWTRSGATSTFTSSAISLLKNASNPASARVGLVINTTATNSAIVAIDLTTDGSTALDLVNNDLTVTPSGTGIFTGTVS